MELTPEVVFALIKSENNFPVDFDDAWRWVGYNQKNDAKKVLEASFDKGFDFSGELLKNGKRGRPIEKIFLTIDCFKQFCMMAGTPKGKEVRRYFLNCEAELKRRLHQEREHHNQRVVAAFVDEQHSSWQKRFEDEFFDEAYRVTGWKSASKGHAPCMGRFIKQNVYEWFPDGVPQRLQEVNPNINGRRKRKHHQHLKRPGITFLDTQKTAVLAVMRLSPANNPQKFSQNLSKALGNAVQLELPFLDEGN